ncbi:amidohydrolase family protein [Christiangramia sabulilitoris]|uniref:Amidohydrolase family protein n=1 Tax=Christiangramia sabulilitoris TaxID=2583991 RepID=A0A550I2F7_9FLAO|nr:amidohydrolase family protein [Christiangramia sabulilitoris]TRO65157.1 amidohydrolase family protein [Christiangramia sabulilitoris]
MKKITWAFLLLLFITYSGRAQDKELAPVTGTVAITNITINPKPGEIIENGTVLVRDGLIEAVGKNIQIPPGARILKADSLHLYPGFILGHSHVGIKMPENKEDRNAKVEDPGNPPNELAGITPERKVYQYLDMTDKSVSEWREAGFTVAQTSPKGGMLPGTGSMILLGGNPENPILKAETALYSTFDGARRMYPATILGVMAHYRQLYRQADQSMEYSIAFDKDPSGRKRPTKNRTLEAFYPVIKNQVPVFFKTEEILEAQRAMILQKDLGFDLVLTELKEGWDLVSDVKTSNSKVQFSLDMPKWEEKKKDSSKTEDTSKEQIALEGRRQEFLKKYYSQMAEYAAAGIPFSFSGLEVKPKDVQKNLQKIVENGLSTDAALAALTTTPARQAGLDKSIGTVEKGKLANLLISNKPYFEKDARIKYVMIEGKLYEYDLKESKKPDAEVLDIVSGDWTFEAETPAGTMTGTITILKDEGGDFTGTIYNTITGQENELRNIQLSADVLSFEYSVTFQSQNLDIEASLTISGESFDGYMEIAGSGESFPVEGSKVPAKRN